MEKKQQTEPVVTPDAAPSSIVDPDLISWEGPDDPNNPRNWNTRWKWATVITASMYSFITPLSSSMVAPSLDVIGRDLHLEPGLHQAIVMSLFVLAYSMGPLFFGPMSELYGRAITLQSANMVYLAFTLACGFAQTQAQMIVCRFFAGLGGSAPLAIGGGIISDLFATEQRGRAVSIYALMPLFGPAVGPIIGAFITEYTSWRWSFYATTIADAVIQVIALVFLRETHAPVLLERKCKALIKQTGNTNLHVQLDQKSRSVQRKLLTALSRPFRLMTTQVTLQMLSLYLMFLFGLLYMVLVSFPTLFTTPPPNGYGESASIGGLNYISLGLGMFLGSVVSAPLSDSIYLRLKEKLPGPGRPEYRVPMMIPGAILVPVGLLVYGWTAEYKTHWIFPNIGACIIALGIMFGSLCTQAYIIDTYTQYAASALAAATVLRSLAGFGFPLFVSSLYEKFGLGWGNSLLALIAIVIGWPSPVLFWFFGQRLRNRSSYSAEAEN